MIVCVFVPYSVSYAIAGKWQNRMTFDKAITKIKRVTFFSEIHCTHAVFFCNLSIIH